jgi:dipeptidyl aminopeptidase/acylaminoacyl peptidase
MYPLRVGADRDARPADPGLADTHKDHASEAPPPQDVPPWLGSRYQVRRVLGRGGMGKVYLAVDLALRCQVALKQVTTSQTGSAALRDEVLLAQKVTHANVCRTYDLEEIDGHWLVKMEYVAGETLAARLRRGALPVAEVVRVARGICAGLAAAHAQGVVHSDLKPANIMIEERTGRVVLMDFGLAHVPADGGLGTDVLVGTPDYMAPEQALGLTLDARADLYALGCVLYEMLTGARVFPSSSMDQALQAHVQKPVPALPPRVPAALRRLVARLLEKEPARRPISADSVAGALARLGRARRLALLAAAAAAGLVAALAFWPAREWQAQIRDLPAYDEDSDAPVFSPDGTHFAYRTNREGTSRLFVEALNGGGARAVTPSGFAAYRPRWTHDGKALLFVNGPKTRVHRVALAGGEPETVAEDAGWADDCAGRLVIAYHTSPSCGECPRLALREPDGGERDLVRFGAHEDVQYVRCDRAGRRLLYSLTDLPTPANSSRFDLWLLELDGGAARRLTGDHAGNVGAFTPDGLSVVYSSARSGQAHLWALHLDGTGAPLQLTAGAGFQLSPDVSPDGRLVLYDVDSSYNGLFAQPLGGGARQKLSARVQQLVNLRPTPDGRAIIAGAIPPSLRAQIVSIPLDGGTQTTLVDGETPALTVDGAEVVFSVTGTGEVRAVPRVGGAARPITTLPGSIRAIHVGDDGKVHVTIAMPTGSEAWVAPLAGGAAERELPSPWTALVPAAHGGWRALLAARGGGYRVRFLAPGAPFDDPAARELSARGRWAFSADGTTWIFNRDGHLFGLDLRTGAERLVAETADNFGVALSPDGKTLYTSNELGQVRRELITNFAELKGRF